MLQNKKHNPKHTAPQAASAPARRRSQRSHQAILTATTQLLQEHGYLGMSIEAIAAQAGVGKQTIYRWWPSKADLVMEAVALQLAREIPLPDTGSVASDLQVFLQRLFAVFATTGARRAVAGLMAEAQINPKFAQAFRKYFIFQRRQAVREILQRGITRGELRKDVDLDLMLDLIYGPMWYRLLTAYAPLDDLFAVELVNHLIIGLGAAP